MNLGIRAAKLITTGNIKLDVRIEKLDELARTRLRNEVGLAEGLVLLGSSTWPGEEKALVSAWQAARSAGLRCSLLIVPRHAERRAEIEQLLRDANVSYHFRSRGTLRSTVDVAVADTTGELRRFTQLADLVFVGKSLPPNDGGQTPVEAAALEKPLLMGPHMSNFRVIAAELIAQGAAIEVPDEIALQREVVALLRDRTRREQMAAAAVRWQRNNAGAVDRTISVVREELAKLEISERDPAASRKLSEFSSSHDRWRIGAVPPFSHAKCSAWKKHHDFAACLCR